MELYQHLDASWTQEEFVASIRIR